MTLMNLLRACWRPSSNQHARAGSDVAGRQDGLLWYKDTGQHVNGEFSMAVVQANNLLEDQCQIESGPLSFLDSGPYGTFVGVYDGHGGPGGICHLFEYVLGTQVCTCEIRDLGRTGAKAGSYQG